MLLTMKAPANRDKGQRTVRCNEQQASILRKVGWTEVVEIEHPVFPEVRDRPVFYADVDDGSSPSNQTLEPEPVTDPDAVRPQYERQGTAYDPDATGHEAVGRDADSPYLQKTDYKISDLTKPKRKYHRRVVKIEPDGKVNYSIKPPKRRYRRRDMTAED